MRIAILQRLVCFSIVFIVTKFTFGQSVLEFFPPPSSETPKKESAYSPPKAVNANGYIANGISTKNVDFERLFEKYYSNSIQDVDSRIELLRILSFLNEKQITFYLFETRDKYEKYYKSGDRDGVILAGLMAQFLYLQSKVSDTSFLTNENRYKVLKDKVFKELFADLDIEIENKNVIYEWILCYDDSLGSLGYNQVINDYKKNKNWEINDANPEITVISNMRNKPIVIILSKPNSIPNLSTIFKRQAGQGRFPLVIAHFGDTTKNNTTIKCMPNNARIYLSCNNLSASSYSNLINQRERVQVYAPILNYDISSVITILKSINLKIIQREDFDWVKFWDNIYLKDNGIKKSSYMPVHQNYTYLYIAWVNHFNKELEEIEKLNIYINKKAKLDSNEQSFVQNLRSNVKRNYITDSCSEYYDSNTVSFIFNETMKLEEKDRLKFLLEQNKKCYTTEQVKKLSFALSNDPERYTYFKKIYKNIDDKVEYIELYNLFSAAEWRQYFYLILKYN